MIKNVVNYIICKIKDHDLVDAGSCPFTGKTYLACIRCEGTISK
jgi:hypothetical protein